MNPYELLESGARIAAQYLDTGRGDLDGWIDQANAAVRFEGESPHRCYTTDLEWIACPPSLCEADNLLARAEAAEARAEALQQERDAERRWCKHWAERFEDAEAALADRDSELATATTTAELAIRQLEAAEAALAKASIREERLALGVVAKSNELSRAEAALAEGLMLRGCADRCPPGCPRCADAYLAAKEKPDA